MPHQSRDSSSRHLSRSHSGKPLSEVSPVMLATGTSVKAACILSRAAEAASQRLFARWLPEQSDWINRRHWMDESPTVIAG
jgi:hypothetical protein